jgi:PLP dependent protein
MTNFDDISKFLKEKNVCLVAVSKTKPIAAIQALYDKGQRDFGENRVQELRDKQAALPKDIRWHLIGHLQTNKVKYIAEWIYMIHSVDSLALLQEINKQALKYNRVILCLLQTYIATEETKFGMDEHEIVALLESEEFGNLKNISISGLMGMATNTDNTDQIHNEFIKLKNIFEQLKSKYFSNNPEFKEISMGMSSDYLIAVDTGSTMVRIGSLLFGERL